MNDTGKQISILKLDIDDGLEVRVIADMIEKDLVLPMQIIVKMNESMLPQRSVENMESMLKSWKTLQSKGYSILDYNPNQKTEADNLRSYAYYKKFDITIFKHASL